MSEHRDPTDDALDELLSRAAWPAIDPAGERRLRQAWRTAFDRRRLVLWPIGLAAAALAGAAVAGWWMLRGPAPAVVAVDPKRHEVEPVVWLNPLPPGETRAPTPYERLIVTPPPAANIARTTAPSRAARATPAPGVEAGREPLDVSRLLQRVLDGSTRDEALHELREMRDPPVEALLEQLASPHVERRFAAARALGEVCRPQVVEVLWRMVARDVYRREALAALTQCHDPLAGRYLAIVNDNPSLESQLRSVRDQMKRYF